MGTSAMKRTFDQLQHAKAQLLLAQHRKDATATEKWRKLVLEWQRVYNAQKRRVA
jgi:hypothetical protein